MLKAFYQQLRHLASSAGDQFHHHVQKRMGDNFSSDFEHELKEAILLVPEVTSRVTSLWSSLGKKSRVKEVGSYFMTYMYSPKDFIPEDEIHGLFGYIDDAYFVFLVYELLTEELVNAKKSLTQDDKGLREKVIGYKRKIKSVIPDEATMIQQMIGEILSGEDYTFTELFGDDPQEPKQGDAE